MFWPPPVTLPLLLAEEDKGRSFHELFTPQTFLS